MPHKWTFYFLMAVGFWNFVGAGIFGFLINLPIVSYFEVGTMLTPNHGHAALMGAFGMEAMALTVMALRQVLPDEKWARPEKYIRVSFWGLNIGLALMVVGNLFPGGSLAVLRCSDQRLLARPQPGPTRDEATYASSNGAGCPAIWFSFSWGWSPW